MKQGMFLPSMLFLACSIGSIFGAAEAKAVDACYHKPSYDLGYAAGTADCKTPAVAYPDPAYKPDKLYLRAILYAMSDGPLFPNQDSIYHKHTNNPCNDVVKKHPDVGGTWAPLVYENGKKVVDQLKSMSVADVDVAMENMFTPDEIANYIYIPDFRWPDMINPEVRYMSEDSGLILGNEIHNCNGWVSHTGVYQVSVFNSGILFNLACNYPDGSQVFMICQKVDTRSSSEIPNPSE